MKEEDSGERTSEAFLLNENPFIFSDEVFGTKELKTKLEALQSLQPPFIPFALDQNDIKNTLRNYYEDYDALIKSFLKDYFADKDIEPPEYDSFLQNKDDEEVINVLTKIKQIKLYNKQLQLRERVYLGLKEVMTAEQLERAHMYKIPDEERDAALVEMLERKNRQEK